MIEVIFLIVIVDAIIRIHHYLSWRSRVCPLCRYRKCVGNFGPCYGCRRGSNAAPDYGEDRT